MSLDEWSSPGEWLRVFQNPDDSPVLVFQSLGGRNWQVERPPRIFTYRLIALCIPS
jgi:hypothetical protein